MGDDAEYYIEQQENEARFKQMCGYAESNRNKKFLLCWISGYAEEVWEWEPLSRVCDIFSTLYFDKKIGSDYFLTKEDLDYEYTCDPESNKSNVIKFIDELEFYVTSSGIEATHEIIVLSQDDAALLKEESIQQKKSAKTLKEEILSEMLEEMALFIESKSQQNKFVFAREL